CVVNGPGEAREADLGITGGYPVHTLYRRGQRIGKVRSEELVARVVEEVERIAAEKAKEQA
ncbi:MAG: 4-hydroxy-3-methylbut-2-en-1-yl diphosphate synthase, partial [Zetaproteobacteria bacterium]